MPKYSIKTKCFHIYFPNNFGIFSKYLSAILWAKEDCFTMSAVVEDNKD